MKMVWLDLETGEFSDSWEEYPENSPFGNKTLAEAIPKGTWKLIKYECINEKYFEFSHRMKIK